VSTHLIVLPGGGCAVHAPLESEPVARWLHDAGLSAGVLRSPLRERHPIPLQALSKEIESRRALGHDRIGVYNAVFLLLAGATLLMDGIPDRVRLHGAR
jgi:hypothetical protein